MYTTPMLKSHTQSYRPHSTRSKWQNTYRTGSDLEFYEVVRHILTTFYGNTLENLARALDHCSVTRIRSSKTGNRISLSIKADRTYALSLHVSEGDSRGSRSDPGVREEACLDILYKHPISSSADPHQSMLLPSILHDVREHVKKKHANKYEYSVRAQEVEAIVLDHLFSLMDSRFIGMKSIAQAVRDFLVTDEVGKNKNSHQTARAIEGVRKAATHAFQHGADIEEIVRAVRECLVANVMDQ